MKKNISILLLILRSQLNVEAQVYTTDLVLDNYYFSQMKNSEELNMLRYEKIKGSPYFKEEFSECFLYFMNDSVYKANMRYNIYEDKMEFIKDNKSYYVYNPEDLKRIVLNGTNFVYFNDKINKANSTYYELLFEGNCFLFGKKRVRFKEEGEEKPYSGREPAEFIKQADYYYLFKAGKSPVLVKSNKIMIDFFDDKKTEIELFIKDNKISYRKLGDLIKLCEYYSQL